MKRPSIYIMTNRRHGVLYIGVTAYLLQRVYQHQEGSIKGFTSRYQCKMLVYYEFLSDMLMALAREKQLKKGSRSRKIQLIESFNPEWNDLYESIIP